MSTLKLSIVSPERKVVENFDATEVTLTGSEGQIQVLPGHAAILGTLETGFLAYRGASGQEEGIVSSGFFEVENDVVTVMAETFEFRREIDLERAKRAQQKAEKALLDASLAPKDFEKYQLKVQRAVIRQHFGGNA